MDTEQIIEKLRVLGPVYHSYFGFHPHVENGDIEVEIDIDGLKDRQRIFNMLNEGWKAEGLPLSPESVDDIPKDGLYLLTVSCEELLDQSLEKIKYKDVILKYKENKWYEMPMPWFNKPSKWWTTVLSHLYSFVLPHLYTRPYIKVVKPFMEVHISTDKKGGPLTLNDILFAGRALALDDTRTYDEGFKLLSDKDGVLVLEPQMDNFST